MSVPFEGAGIPPVSPEEQKAIDFADGYKRMLTEKYRGDVWDESRPNGSRIAELEITVWDKDTEWSIGSPYVNRFLPQRLPVTITDNGPDTTRPLLEMSIPKGLDKERGSWSDSGVLQVGRDGSFTFQSYDQETGIFENRNLSDKEIAAIQNRFTIATLFPKHDQTAMQRAPIFPTAENIMGQKYSYGHDGLIQWDEHPRRTEFDTDKSGLIDRMLADMGINKSHLSLDIPESRTQKPVDEQHGINNDRLTAKDLAFPPKSSPERAKLWREMLDGYRLEYKELSDAAPLDGSSADTPKDEEGISYGMHLGIDYVLPPKRFDLPQNDPWVGSGKFGSDHMPVNAGISASDEIIIQEKSLPPSFEEIVLKKSRESLINPSTLINRATKNEWFQFPSRTDVFTSVEGLMLDPTELYPEVNDPVTEPGEQTPEDK